MKTTKLFIYLSLAMMVVSFTACSDDDEDAVQLSSLVAGSYTGTITMSFAYATLEYTDRTVYISADGSSSVNVSISDSDLGVMSISGVPLVMSGDNVVKLVESEGVLSMPTHDGGFNDYACLVSGEISIDGSDFEIVFSMPAVMGGTTYVLVPAGE